MFAVQFKTSTMPFWSNGARCWDLVTLAREIAHYKETKCKWQVVDTRSRQIVMAS